MAVPNRPWWQRGPALPLLISAAAHGLLFLFLVEVPWRQAGGPAGDIDTRVVVEVARLSLAPDTPSPTAPAGGSVPGAGEEAGDPPPTYSVQLVEPPLLGHSQTALPAPTLALPTPAGGTSAGVPPVPGNSGPGDAGPNRGGSGGGQRFFADVSDGQSVVYVIDRSLSMGPNQGWARARQELLVSLGRLPPTARFQVIPYNREAESLRINGRSDLLPADAETAALVQGILLALHPSGGTEHVKALRRGLSLRPDLLYFVTDADELSLADVSTVTQFNAGRTTIHVLALGPDGDEPTSPLRQLAGRNRGTYRPVTCRGGPP